MERPDLFSFKTGPTYSLYYEPDPIPKINFNIFFPSINLGLSNSAIVSVIPAKIRLFQLTQSSAPQIYSL
jgi:hypothetical protein